MSVSATELLDPPVATRRPLGPPPIWTRAQQVVLATTALVGAVVLIISWIGASGTTDWDDQVRWTAIGAIGAAIGAFAGGCWLMVGFAAVKYRARFLTSVLAPAVRGERTGAAPSDARSSRGTAVSADSMTRYHDPDCYLVRGKPTQVARIDELEAQGRRPCGVCKP